MASGLLNTAGLRRHLLTSREICMTVDASLLMFFKMRVAINNLPLFCGVLRHLSSTAANESHIPPSQGPMASATFIWLDVIVTIKGRFTLGVAALGFATRQ